MSCAEGEEGFVYRGRLPVRIERTNLADLPRPRTQMMMNVGEPGRGVLACRSCPNDGVGLARLEFIISTHVRAHPMALLHPERDRRSASSGGRSSASRADTPTRDSISSIGWPRAWR